MSTCLLLGPMILGHAHPAVIDATEGALRRGTSFGTVTPGEVELAEELVARAPWRRSGWSAPYRGHHVGARLARGFTGRRLVVSSPAAITGSRRAAGRGRIRVATFGLPDSPGVTGRWPPTPWCCLQRRRAVRQAFAENGGQIACVITEACPANMGVVPPAAGFNELLALLCREHGALLIMDEVLTGFRVTRSGWYGREGTGADLMTFGKVMGGGLPTAAFGGRAEIMDRMAPAGRCTRRARCPANPLATAAGLATLRACTMRSTPGWTRQRRRWRSSRPTRWPRGVQFRLQDAGSLFSVFLGWTLRCAILARRAPSRRPRTLRFFHAMLDRGVYLPPSPYEAWFLSAAHDDAAVSRVAARCPPRPAPPPWHWASGTGLKAHAGPVFPVDNR